MPIYEYECKNCHHHFDLLQKISDTPEKQCPECKQDTAIRLVSAAGFQLKGSGWYATDFKTKSKPESSKEGGADKSSGSETKATETKSTESSTTSSTKGEKE